ncbi:MAG: methyltransferase domain-containing protein [Chloroflexi bacterium]|nr:methyltransferase domain-containing protein [Chloroflexota bacterium]
MSDDDPTDWFEPLYAGADASGRGVPWARMQPDSMLAEWLARAGEHGGQALVIGSGLGDDAEAAAAAGYATTAFDVAPSAIKLARQRFPESAVAYRTADLLDLPPAWQAAFDLVVEIRTVQSLPPDVQPEAVAAVRQVVAPGGRLFVGALVRADWVPVQGPPWPLSEPTFAAFGAGFTLSRQQQQTVGPGIRRVWHVYRRD